MVLLPTTCPCTAGVSAAGGDPGPRTITGQTLRKIHPTDLWEAIKMIEPSLVEIDENMYGSDPNGVPGSVDMAASKRWSLDGLSTSTLPVFIIDGAVVNARRVCDLNISMVESVIIRNDAAGLAGYGLRGGNGVIEINTVRPQAGPLRLTYRFDGSVQWADLGSYKLMNSTQKLAFEKVAGLYTSLSGLLSEREGLIAGGADKDWLKVPLRTAFQNRHMIDVSGGDEFVKYRMGLRLATAAQGVMKGSKHDIYGADAYIEYRYRSLTLSNGMSLDKIYANASNYGAFDYYTSVNPYFLPAYSNGVLAPMLGDNTFNQQLNPEYEASLSSFNKDEAYGIWNNFQASLRMGSKLRIDGRFTLAKDKGQNDCYISPSSGIFAGLGDDEAATAGAYHIVHRNNTTYEGDLSLHYADHAGLSSWGGAMSCNFFQGETDRDYYGGTGIPNDRMGFISFTGSYDPSLTPDAVRYHDRNISALLSGYYDYDGRYRTEVFVRADKSSRLARDRQSVCFYGVSAVWNIHNEKFLSGSRAIQNLSLGGGFSTTGAIDFTDAAHMVKYSYNIGNEYIYDYYLIGAGINSLPNPELKPRVTQHANVSLTAATRWFSLYLNYFSNMSKNLLTVAPTALATGFDDMPSNGGRILSSGLMFSLACPVINTGDLSLSIHANGIHRNNTIKSVPTYFKDIYNRSIIENLGTYIALGMRPALLAEGGSAEAIYAVRSAGLDGSGHELFYDKNGNVTPIWNASDMVAAGDATPKLRGSLGVQGTWKRWTIHVFTNYSLGGDIYNQTLHTAQNGSAAYNGDQRMADRSVRAGNAEAILATSRFVEKNNEFSLGSVGAGYSFLPASVRKLGLKGLNLNLTGNRLLHASSSDYQRGIYYPFARTVTLSLSAIF